MDKLIEELKAAKTDDEIDAIFMRLQEQSEAAEKQVDEALKAYVECGDKKSVRAFHNYQEKAKRCIELQLANSALGDPKSSVIWQLGCLGADSERTWERGREQSHFERILRLESSVRYLSGAVFSLLALIEQPEILRALQAGGRDDGS